MSLLRRIERSLPDEPDDEDDDSTRSSDSATMPPADSPVCELWHHRAGSKLLSVAMTRDNRFIIAGSAGGNVLFFDAAGRLLWNGQVQGAVNRIALAENADCFIVGAVGNGKNAYVWHYSGRLLHTYPTQGAVWGVDMTPDASLAAVGSLDKHLYTFDSSGQPVFKHLVGSPIRHVALTSDGSRIFASAEDHAVHAFDRQGSERWTYPTGGSVWAGTRLAEQAHCLVAGSNDGHVYGLDFEGNGLWQFDTGGPVNALAVTADGSLCAAAGKSNTVYLLNDQGNVLWEYQTGDQVYGLSLSMDGRFVLIGSNDNTLTLVDCQHNHRVWEQSLDGRVYAAALTPGGRFFAAASADCQTYVFHNTSVQDNSPELFGADNKLLMRLIVQHVRDDYALNPHMGLVRWFSEFERSLRNNQFDVCRALLNEAHEENSIGLSDGERQYTRSLEGAYWLFRGIAFHRIGHYAEARECYEKSQAIHTSTDNQDGVGQVIAALSSLPEVEPGDSGEPLDPTSSPILLSERVIPPGDQKLLDEIIAKPRVLGTSEQVLEYRLAQASPAEQFQIVLLAKQSGYITPLIRALGVEERIVRAAASAALTLLQPGPNDGVLEIMLVSPQSFVRWQALRILRHRAHNDPLEFTRTRDRLWPAVISEAASDQRDTLVRREEALLAKEAGEESDTSWLIARINDPDPDVQIAVIEALGAIGDRRALPELARVQNRIGFLGASTKAAADEATASVQKRYPMPTVEKVILCQADPLQQRMVQQSTLFLPETDAVYCIVTVDHVHSGARVAAKWLHRGKPVKEEAHEVTQEAGPPIAEAQEITIVTDGPPTRPSPFRRPPSDDEDEDSDDSPPARSPFGRPSSGDRPASPFARREPEDAPRPSPFGTRPGSLFDRPGSAPRPAPPRPGAFGARPGSFPDPNENTESVPGSPFQRSPEEPASEGDDSPQLPSFLRNRRPASPFAPARPADNEPAAPAESNLVRRFLAGPPPTPPPPPPPRSPFGGPPRPASPPGPFGSRPGAPAANPFRNRDTDTPPWLARMRGEDRPAPTRPGLPSRPPFGRDAAPQSQNRPQPAGPSPFGSLPRRSPTARRFVFSLPRPEAGWQTDAYQIEVAVDGESKGRTDFKVVEAISLTGLEPGIAGAAGEKDFGRSHVLLATTHYIDCLAHLKEAPVNTQVTGRLYNAASGVLLGESTAATQKQGRQAVQLSWENPGWRTGHYRLVVSVAHGNELTTEVELVSRLKVTNLVICHQVDDQNGPIGVHWPFYPGDTCRCVLELEAPPPGVEIQAAWYRKNQALVPSKAKPYITTPGGDQRAVFKLSPEQASLAPGHYSVVIQGKEVARQEHSFEVLPRPPLQLLRHAAQRVIEKIAPSARRYHLDLGAVSAGAIVLLALFFMALSAGAERVLDHSLLARDAMLTLGYAAGHPTPGWGLAWLILAGGYGTLHARRVYNMASPTEREAFTVINLLLVFAVGTLSWYQMSFITMGLGRLWPGTWWGFFKSLNWLTPVLTWLAPLVGVGLVEKFRQGDTSEPFYWSIAYSAILFLGLALAGYFGAVVIGFTLGLAGAIVGGLLDIGGTSNNLGRTVFYVGTALGFVVFPVTLVAEHYREELKSLWNEWLEERGKPRIRRFTLLNFLLEKSPIPVRTEESLRLAVLCLRVLALVGLAAVLLAAIFNPAILPILKWLYHTHESRSLSAPRLVPVLAFALLVAWPGLVYGFYKTILAPGLDDEGESAARRFSIVAGSAAVLAPIGIAFVSRTPIGREYPARLSVFWTNRLVVLGVLMVVGGYAALLFRQFPQWLKIEFHPKNTPVDKLTMGLIVVLAAALLPIWMWTLLLVVICGIAGIGTYVLHDMT